MRTLTTAGFTLLEVAAALFIIGIMTALLIPLATSLVDANRATQTYDEMATLYSAIMGNPANKTYGYMGDVGKFPDNLLDLIQKPASNPAGWNGPYITTVRVENGVLYDPYGSPYECYFFRDTSNGSTAPDQFALISRGPDRFSTNTSATPNQCSTFAGTLPSDPAYASQSGNADNVLFPRFTDNSGLLSVQQIGTLALNVFNYDDNAPVAALVPGCPHAFTITVASVSRGTSDTFSMPYNSGANSIDLPEGLYDVQVTSQTAQGVLWEQQAAITPGTTASFNLNLAGINSSQTPVETFKPVNTLGFTILVKQFTTTLGTVTNGNTGTFSVNPCSNVIIRNNSAPNPIVDAFTYPYLTPTSTQYFRRLNANALFNLTVTNRNLTNLVSKEQLFVYEEGLLVGVVGSRGSKKTKTFTKIRSGNPLDIFDRLGNDLSSTTMGNGNTSINVN